MKTLFTARTWVIALCTALLLLAVGACSDREARHSRIDHSLDYMAYRLAFDPAQKAIVEKLKLELADIRSDTAQQRQQLREQRFDQAAAWLNAESLAAEQIAAELEQLLAVHKQQADEMLPRIWPIVSELHASLNVEQKAKLEKKLQRWQSHSQQNQSHQNRG